MKTLIFVLCLMMFTTAIVAQVSDDFLVGCYSYMKAGQVDLYGIAEDDGLPVYGSNCLQSETQP